MDNAGRIANKRLLLYIQWFEDGERVKERKRALFNSDIVFRFFLNNDKRIVGFPLKQ